MSTIFNTYLSAIASCICSINAKIPFALGVSSVDEISNEISKAIKEKTNTDSFSVPIIGAQSQLDIQNNQLDVNSLENSGYSTDLCNFASQILESSGEVTHNDVCNDAVTITLDKINIIPGTKYYLKNSLGGKELNPGAYFVQYIDGTVFDGSQPDCGYFVGSGTVNRGLVLNVECNGTIKQVPMPFSSQIVDPHDKNQVINSYLTGPITEMIIGASADEGGDKMWLEFITNNQSMSNGSISLYIKYCTRCQQ
jgi:hypothetical protein